MRAAGRSAFGLQRGVRRREFLAVDLLADQEGAVTGIGDLDLLQHLANDHLDMLVMIFTPCSR